MRSVKMLPLMLSAWIVMAAPAFAFDQADVDTCNHAYSSADHVAAIEACTHLVGQLDNDNNAKILRLRGLAYRANMQLSEAIADASESIRLKPSSAAYQDRGASYDLRNEFALAIADFTAAIALAPKQFNHYDARCQARAQANIELDQALADCNMAINLAPVSTLYGSRGLVYLRMGRLQDALADYDRACASPPLSAFAFYGRGVVKIRLGDKGGGETDIKTAEAMYPTLIIPSVDKRFASWGITPQ